MTQRIENDSFNKMNHAIRVSTQIENISGNILIDLTGQTNVMKNSLGKIGNMNGELESSKSYLIKMLDKEKYDKKVIILVGLFLLMITLFVLFYKIFQKFRK